MRHSVIIILGYKNDASGKLHPIAQQRADKALAVYQSITPAQKNVQLICTGGFGENFNQSDTAHGKRVQNYLENKGIPGEAFLSHAPSVNTYEDGRFCKDIIQTQIEAGQTISNIHLVTSEFHMKRGFLWLNHFCPEQHIVCQPANTIASSCEMETLKAHEQQAIDNFYRDFPDTQ